MRLYRLAPALLALLLPLAATLAPATQALAQKHRAANTTPEQRAQRATDTLNAVVGGLDAGQRDQVYAIMLKYEKLRQDQLKGQPKSDEKNALRKELMAPRRDELKAVLTDDQWDKLVAWKKAKRSERRARRGSSADPLLDE